MNKQTRLLSAVLAVGSLLLLSGCANYKAMTLPQLTQHSHQSEKKNLSLEHKVFDKADCQEYLGRKNLLKKGFQPVQLTVTNNTNRNYVYSSSSLSLPTVPVEVVAKKVYYSTGGRAVGVGIAAAVGSVLAVTAIVGGCGVLGASWFWHYVFPPALLFSGVPFTAGATASGIKASKANKDLKVDFVSKAFPREGILRPYQSINGIVFVQKKSFNPNFTFILNDTNSNKAVILNSVSNNITIQ